ncbi:hypothetical protein ACLOJK_017935 [Asimina triloba]
MSSPIDIPLASWAVRRRSTVAGGPIRGGHCSDGQMGSVESDHDEECMEDVSACQFLSPSSSILSGIYGEPQLPTRIGSQYQVEVPTLPIELENLQLSHSPIGIVQVVDFETSIQIGLPIPVMWVHGVADQLKHKEMELIGNTIDAQTNKCVESEKVLDEMDVDSSVQQVDTANHENKSEVTYCVPVPGLLGSSWSDAEQEIFILGLYIFGKNLLQVKRFVGSKEMGDIQSFYYGKFYGSDSYCRWSECRKMRNRKFIHGQRIFTGWRQQELLSRLLPHVSEECRNTLLEATKAFGEGKVSLEEYISTLKAMVGLEILVGAVGVGKGKLDLTGVSTEPVKTNPSVSSRSEVPTGKACSSLTSAEIIKFLTGDFRLSKARSSDLFWEAVWPRLLASGWHSEQPKDDDYAMSISKPSLVFLVPGIKKFSRRKLVKGNHYFDSVTDVLTKVASDPMLLEFEAEADHGSREQRENGLDSKAKFLKMSSLNHQRRCYLRPRVQNSGPHFMSFTIVDTSLIDDEKSHKVRELRNLPTSGTAVASQSASFSSESANGNSFKEEPAEKLASADAVMNDQEGSHPMTSDDKRSGMLIDGPDYAISHSKQGIVDGGFHSSAAPNVDNQDAYAVRLTKKEPGKRMKRQFSRRVESVHPKYSSPALKRRRLSACNREASKCYPNTLPKDDQLNEKDHQLLSHSPEGSNTVVAEVLPSQPKVSSSSSGRGSGDENSECIPSENGFSTSTICETVRHRKPQKKALIDLNVPHVSEDFETDGPLIETADSHGDLDTRGSSIRSESNERYEDSQAPATSIGTESASVPFVNGRRQSTRNRALTTRVLEAFECGLFNTRRRRGTKAQPSGKTEPRSRRQTHHDNDNDAGNNVADSKVDGLDEECSSNTNEGSKRPIQAGRKGSHKLSQAPRSAYQPGIFMGNDNGCG